MKKRLSRWSRDKRPDGQEVTLTKRDIELFTLLHPERFRYLPTSYIHAFMKGDKRSIQNRLELLVREPNYYLFRPIEQRPYIGLYRDQLYSLDNRGHKELSNRGLLPDDPLPAYVHRNLVHAVTTDMVWASFELSLPEGHRVITPREILTYEKFPAKQRELERPFTIPVDVKWTFKNTERKSFTYEPDGIRGIELPDNKYRFFSLEVEHKNRMDCTNLNQTSFLKKALAIKKIMDEGLYHKHWGLPNLTTIVVTNTASKIDVMKQIATRVFGKQTDHILFTTFPFLDDLDAPLKPVPDFYTKIIEGER